MNGIDTRRAQLRADIAIAARVVPTHYPLATFIAVNPLAGLEGLPFEQAIRRAGDLYGMRGTLSEEEFRGLHQAGRITDSDLDGVLARRYHNLLQGDVIQLGDRAITPAELLRGDLLHGVSMPKPLRRYRTRAEQRDPAVMNIVDSQAAKWCAAYFGKAGWPMPGRKSGFYPAWRALAPSDSTLGRPIRAALRLAPERADDAVLDALAALGIDDEARVVYLQAHLTRLPGWAAHVQWCGSRDSGITLMDYLAVRLAYESALLALSRPGADMPAEPDPELPSARQRAAHLVDVWGLTDVTAAGLAAAGRVLSALPVSARAVLWQNAFEANYRGGLLADLSSSERIKQPGPAHTQLVSCIDTRSEGLRRHLESVNGYDTFGFAGFFAVAIRFTGLLGGAPSDLCPVLISPDHDINEMPAPWADGVAARHAAGATGMAGAESAFHAAKDSLAAPFVLAEAAGWAAAPLSAAKTLTPSVSGRIRRRLRELVSPSVPTVLDLGAMPLTERVLFAQVALTTMGLVDGFARLVVLCGHGSTTENNPYQAALDCGACGGQAGGPNARTAVAILNQADVRAELRTLGIDIPDQTQFVAAEHDTATDRVIVLDTHLIPVSHRAQVADCNTDLARAGAALAAERCAQLPGAPRAASPARAARHVFGRSVDWAQVYPEWGLVGNAAFVVAPREISRGIDLQRRVFLHSYEADVDPDGTALETILTAPLVVAQWINCQYYFSTVAPEVFGAGTKTIHNVVGNAGVIAGHTGDLQLGLPWQSVAQGRRLLHEPLRLLAVIQAPLARIDDVVNRNPILQKLFGNDWIGVAARESSDDNWQRWTRGGWQSWDDSHCSAALFNAENFNKERVV